MQKYYEVHDRSIKALIEGRSVRHVKANEQLSFDARRGETVAIVGESGCGKSTFAKVLMGLETATDGTIRHDGNEISKIRFVIAHRARSARFRWCSRTRSTPSIRATPSESQIGRVIKKFGVETDKTKIQARVLELLDIVKLPRDFYIRRPRQLSGGQKQRIGSHARSPETPRW